MTTTDRPFELRNRPRPTPSDLPPAEPPSSPSSRDEVPEPPSSPSLRDEAPEPHPSLGEVRRPPGLSLEPTDPEASTPEGLDEPAEPHPSPDEPAAPPSSRDEAPEPPSPPSSRDEAPEPPSSPSSREEAPEPPSSPSSREEAPEPPSSLGEVRRPPGLSLEPTDPEPPSSRPPATAVGSVPGWTWALLAVSLAALVFGVVQWRTGPTEDQTRAAARDQAVIQGIRAVETLQTLDHREVSAGVERWQSVTTGVLHDQFVAISDEQRDALVKAGKVTTARVVSAALTDLEERTATLIASTEVTVASPDTEDSEPTVKRNRYAADLTLVKGRWKIENIQLVQVSVS